MKTIEIVGENFSGKWTRCRIGCRGIILDGEKILLSYEVKNDQWMIPGGGLEAGESDLACCTREIAEETGVTVNVSDCALEIDEYYEDVKWVNRYFIGRVIGHTEPSPTDAERAAGLVPRWIGVEECKRIFASHASYAGTDEMKRGMYYREYTALCELLK